YSGLKSNLKVVQLWMENLTFTPLRQPIVFELEGFDVPPGHGPLLFFLALFAYMVVLLGNGVVICVVMTDRNLHRPMFVMICHLVVCDLLGATAVLPSLMMHFLTGQRKISYLSAIIQGFCVHTYGVAMHTILGVMAIDRVKLLSYIIYAMHSTDRSVFFAVSLHHDFGSAAQLLRCGLDLCSGAHRCALLLPCKSSLLHTGMFIIIAFSYIRILAAVLKHGRTDSSIRTKAFQTCASHLVVYVFYEIATLIIVVSYRFPSITKNITKFLSILFIIVPPAINPIIYGLVSRDLRSSIIKRFSTRTAHKNRLSVTQ
uniref:G-protein coupled receptors family 1 profile domain-containing protein n=1 Tax=Poecilia reticulata TaxID=8081 RepID=A0A3P9N2D8_POERE